MYITRDIFHLKFGHFKDAKALFESAIKDGFLPEAVHGRILSDFTGDSYRLVLEQSFNSLADYEKHLQQAMAEQKWQQWYEQLKQHIERSHREILKQVL